MSKNHHPLVRFAVERRVTMAMLLVAVFVLGWLSLERLPLEFLPTISSSNVSVQAPYASASPQEIERRIVRPLEDSLGTLAGVDRLSATAASGNARLDVSFVDGTDMEMAAVEVRDRVDRVRHLLPDDLRNIRIRRFQTSDIPVMRFHVTSNWSDDRFLDFVERVLQRRLERLDGVAQVDLRGLRSRQVQIQLDASRLAAHRLDVRQLTSVLRQNHLDVSAGRINDDGRELRVRVLGQLRSLEDVADLAVGSGLRLRDVARITYDYPEQESFNFLNGTESLTVGIYKVSDSNLLQVVDNVKAELASITAEPRFAGISTHMYHDSSTDVRLGLGQLRNTGLLGGLLAILAVFLFLRRWRTTLLVGIAIPVSVIFTFVLIFLMRQAGWIDMTLNVVSLMGLVLALGMLVDNSIVVIESIYRRQEQFGDDPRNAALRGASDVALPILASTATTLCVFIPVIFLSAGGGFFKRYFVEIGTTVCIVMVASLIVALTVVPMTAAMLLGREAAPREGWLHKLGQGYAWTLKLTLRYRSIFLVLAALSLWWSWWLFSGIERSFGSRTQARQVTVNVDTPRNYSLEQTRQLFEELRVIIDGRREELDIENITSSFFAGGGRARGRDRRRQIDLYLKDESKSSLTTSDVRDKIREMLPVKAGVELRIAQAQRRHGGGGVEVELSGDDPAVLELVGRQVASRIAQVPMIVDVDLSLDSGGEELVVQVDRERATQAGLTSQAVAATVQSSLSERALSYMSSDDREVDLVMMFAEEERETLGQLRNVEIHGAGGSASLDSLAQFAAMPGPRSIDRENRQAKIKITTNTDSPRAMGMAMREVGQIMGSLSLPPGYEWSFGRWNRMSQRDQDGSSFALLFAIILVYMLMAALFESFGQPLAIMTAVPFAFVGVGLVMKLAEQPRDNFTELGFIILIGVVVNNAIVLVDHINQLRREGAERTLAIIQGGRDRLRAILMTAITTIFGLAPMVAPVLFPQYFGPLEGRAATWAPVGLVILGGLTTSTFLTLLIVPTFYSLLDDAARFVRRLIARLA